MAADRACHRTDVRSPMKNNLFRLIPAVMFLSASVATVRAQETPEQPENNAAPHILLDKNPRIVAYQLSRLNNPQLIALERHPDQAKYKPVYAAILSRKGLDRKYREEALKALAQ